MAIGSGAVALVSLAALPFFIYYVMAERSRIATMALAVVPAEFVYTARDLVGITGRVFSAWVRSQILLSTSVGVPVFIIFALLGIFVDPFYGQFALLFGVISFCTEFIPIIGSYIAMIPAIVICLAGVGPSGALVALVVFGGVQLFEGSILVPKIQGGALDLPAAVVLLALVIGAALGGLLGVLVSLPVTATLKAVVDYLYGRAAGGPGITTAPDPTLLSDDAPRPASAPAT